MERSILVTLATPDGYVIDHFRVEIPEGSDEIKLANEIREMIELRFETGGRS